MQSKTHPATLRQLTRKQQAVYYIRHITNSRITLALHSNAARHYANAVAQ